MSAELRADQDPLWWLHPREWPTLGERGSQALGRTREALGAWAATLRREPDVAATTARREVGSRVRDFLGLAGRPS